MGSSRAEAERQELDGQVQDTRWNKGRQEELRDWTPSWVLGEEGEQEAKKIKLPPPDRSA